MRKMYYKELFCFVFSNSSGQVHTCQQNPGHSLGRGKVLMDTFHPFGSQHHYSSRADKFMCALSTLLTGFGQMSSSKKVCPGLTHPSSTA